MRKTFQMFFTSGEAAGAGAGSGKADEKIAGDGKAAADGKTPEAAKAPPADGTKTPEQIAADAAKAPPAGETPEQKTVREKKEADDAAAADAGKPKPPAKYDLKIGKDAETFIDSSDVKLIEKLARDKGLSNEQAQSLVDARAEALLEQSVAFRAVTEADPTYGGDKLEVTEKHAKLALDKLRPAGTPRGDAFRQILAKTGFGNNLEVVSFLADLGAQLAEDQPGIGTANTGGRDNKDVASKFYDHPTSKATTS